MNINTKFALPRIGIAVLTLACSSCAEAKNPERLSLLPTLENMKPVIVCLTKAQPNDKGASEQCARNGGIALTDRISEPPTLNDIKLQLIGLWMYVDRDPVHRISISDFDQVVDYARCIETAAYADRGFSSRSENGVGAAQMRAEFACRSHPLSMTAISPQAVASGHPIPNARQMMFARSLAGMSINYALEANGLMTNAMRPCIRYLDGRPPSRGCAGKSEGRPPAPPPSYNR